MLLLYFPSSQYCANALHRVRVYGLALNTCFGGHKHCWKCSKVSFKKTQLCHLKNGWRWKTAGFGRHIIVITRR